MKFSARPIMVHEYIIIYACDIENIVFKIQNSPNNNVTNHGFQRDLMLITCWLPTLSLWQSCV